MYIINNYQCQARSFDFEVAMMDILEILFHPCTFESLGF